MILLLRVLQLAAPVWLALEVRRARPGRRRCTHRETEAAAARGIRPVLCVEPGDLES